MLSQKAPSKMFDWVLNTTLASATTCQDVLDVLDVQMYFQMY